MSNQDPTMSNQAQIDVSQIFDVKIEKKDGVPIVTRIEKKGKYPEKGYFLDRVGTLHKIE